MLKGKRAHDNVSLGLINCRVTGGYESTPGNGCGALDDCETYEFSICEFCLDWLFQQFKTPPALSDNLGDSEKTYRPANQRVQEDEWRRMKAEHFAESDRRAALRRRLG